VNAKILVSKNRPEKLKNADFDAISRIHYDFGVHYSRKPEILILLQYFMAGILLPQAVN